MSIDATRWAWSIQGISATDKIVLLSLADRAGESHEAWPSQARLAFDTGLNIKTITACIRRLINAGHILDTGKRTGNTSQVVVYKLVGVDGREDPQNRGALDDERPPILPTNTPKIGAVKDPQNWGTESTNINLPRKRPKKTRAKLPLVTLTEWLDNLGDDDAIPPDDPIYGWAETQGYPAKWIGVYWLSFKDFYTTGDPGKKGDTGKEKLQQDWRAAFRTSCKNNYRKIWATDRKGDHYLTDAGKAWERLHDSD